jgi:hypothetical protein
MDDFSGPGSNDLRNPWIGLGANKLGDDGLPEKSHANPQGVSILGSFPLTAKRISINVPKMESIMA